MRQTPLSSLIDLQLGGRLRQLVLDERGKGSDWRTIAATIQDRTGTRVSYESLRSWFADELDAVIESGAA